MFGLLILFLPISPAFAQSPSPAWLSQLKLSGLSGTVDQPIAIINDKTFSPGEENTLKLSGHAVSVTCKQIGVDSVLIQIQGFVDLYVLPLNGQLFPLASRPTKSKAASPPAAIKSPAPPVQPSPAIKPASPARPQIYFPPLFASPLFAPSAKIYFVGTVLALVFGIFLGVTAVTSVQGYRHRKNFGEALVAETISHGLNHPHLLLNNVTLPTADGTTQIDHILVATTGIFVIETKHYTGWIFGGPDQGQWTQQIFKRKSRFQNPLRQNFGHVQTLQSLFNLPADHFYSLVVFTGDAVFKTELGPNVVHLSGLLSLLNAVRPEIFDERKLAYIIGRIEMQRERRSVETDEYHINHVRSKLERKSKHPRTNPYYKLTPLPENPGELATPVSPPASENPDARFMPKN